MLHTGATILCIDGNWKELIELKLVLEREGFNVLAASGWEEGMQLFNGQSVNAVVLDYQTPGVSGNVVGAMMKRLKPYVPVLLLSAYGPLPRKKLRGVDTFLYKSEIPAVLLPAVRDLLAGRPKLFFYRWLDHWKSRNPVRAI